METRLFRPVAVGFCAVGLLAPIPGCLDKGNSATSKPVDVAVVIGEVGISPGQFAYPRAMDADGDSLWVIDKAARVQHLDLETHECLSLWTMPEFERGKPTGVTLAPDPAIDPSGRDLLWIPDTHYHRVMVYRIPEDRHATPELALKIGGFGEGPGQFIYPTDVAVLAEPGSGAVQRVYVTEYGGNDRVSIYEHDASGALAFVRSFGAFGSSAEKDHVEFSRPQSIQIDHKQRELIITDACNHRLGRFTLEGELIAWIGSPDTAGDGPGQFRYPYGLFLPGDGSALIAEYGNSRVQRIELATGHCLATFGRPGRGPGDLAAPWAVTMVGGRLYILDSGNNRVVGCDPPGIRLAAGGTP